MKLMDNPNVISIAVRNVTNRPLSFEFLDGSVTVLPGKVSEYYPISKWKDTFAEKQLVKYVNDREAVIKPKLKDCDNTVTAAVSVSNKQNNNKKKGRR